MSALGEGSSVRPERGENTLPWPSTVQIPARWDALAVEIDGRVSITIGTPTATAAMVLDLGTGERVLSLDRAGAQRIFLRRLLMVIADERDVVDEGIRSAGPGVRMQHSDIATWTPMQVLAAATHAVWLPPSFPRGRECRNARYRWVYEYRRVNAAIASLVEGKTG